MGFPNKLPKYLPRAVDNKQRHRIVKLAVGGFYAGFGRFPLLLYTLEVHTVNTETPRQTNLTVFIRIHVVNVLRT